MPDPRIRSSLGRWSLRLADEPMLSRVRPPPVTLHVLGQVPPRPRVAIVGTRRADPEAEDFASKLAGAVVAAGAAVVSGGARGIDAAAHRGALDAGGATLAVLATGLTVAYPREHGALFTEIAAHGGLLSEHDDDAEFAPWRFLHRNRIVAALSDAVVVVQAPRRSGALSTAAVARSLGLPVLAVPSSPWDPRSEGSNDLLARAFAIPAPSSSPVLAALGLADTKRVGRARRKPPSTSLSDDAAVVLAELGSRPRMPDELVARTGLAAARVQAALLELVLAGDAAERRGGRYVAVG